MGLNSEDMTRVATEQLAYNYLIESVRIAQRAYDAISQGIAEGTAIASKSVDPILESSSAGGQLAMELRQMLGDMIELQSKWSAHSGILNWRG